jgi:hypothetical protein
MAEDDQGESVVGTWIGKATFDNPPGTPPGTPQLMEAELASVHHGGMVTGTSGIDHSSQNPFVPPGLAVELSDYLGTWEPIGDSDKIAVTFKRLLFLGPNTLDPAVTAIYCPATKCFPGPFPGQNIGRATIQSVLKLQHTKSGDTLSGPFTFQLTNLKDQVALTEDQVVLTGSGTVSLSRVPIEPLATH